MKISVGAVGRMRKGAENDLFCRYIERSSRLGPQVGLTGFACTDFEESQAQTVDLRKADEAARLEKLASNAMTLVLDERGKTLSSRELASWVSSQRDDGCDHIVALLGGPDGHHPDIRKKAGLTFSFGRITFPHMLARVVLAEQLYRVTTILAGHPYHRD